MRQLRDYQATRHFRTNYEGLCRRMSRYDPQNKCWSYSIINRRMEYVTGKPLYPDPVLIPGTAEPVAGSRILEMYYSSRPLQRLPLHRPEPMARLPCSLMQTTTFHALVSLRSL